MGGFIVEESLTSERVVEIRLVEVEERLVVMRLVEARAAGTFGGCRALGWF